MKEILNNKKQKCRLCLQKPTTALPITENNTVMIESLTYIKINPEEPIFNVICSQCKSDLELINKILCKIRSADIKFREMIEKGNEDEMDEKAGQNINIKSEFPTLETEEFIVKEENVEFITITGEDTTEIETKQLSPEINDNCNNMNQFNTVYLQQIADKPYKCDECGRKYLFRGQLVRHRYAHLRKECPICKSSITRSNFKKHLKNHTLLPAKWECEICRFKAKTSNILKNHYKGHTETYTCEHCSEKFPRPLLLKMHINKKHLNDGRKVFCEVCDEGFMTLLLLRKHCEEAHGMEKPYVCRYCDRRFAAMSSRKAHERQHTNQKSNRCEICGKGFRLRDALRFHMKLKHNIVIDIIQN